MLNIDIAPKYKTLYKLNTVEIEYLNTLKLRLQVKRSPIRLRKFEHLS